MSDLTRRGFFWTLAALVSGAVAAVTAKSAPTLVFHKDAFFFAMQNMPLAEFKAQYPHRLGVLSGFGEIDMDAVSK